MNTALLLVLFAHGSAALPPLDCFHDDECGAGLGCRGGACVSLDELCADSDACGDGQVCDVSYNTCQEGETSTRCVEAGGLNGSCTDIPSDDVFCTADADCPDDELCWVTFTVECGEGDATCDDLGFATCVPWARFCGADNPIGCSAQESCIDERCTWEGWEEEAGSIVRDDEKEEILKPRWNEGACANLPETCEVPWYLAPCSCTAVTARVPASVFALAFVGLVLLRRRR